MLIDGAAGSRAGCQGGALRRPSYSAPGEARCRPLPPAGPERGAEAREVRDGVPRHSCTRRLCVPPRPAPSLPHLQARERQRVGHQRRGLGRHDAESGAQQPADQPDCRAGTSASARAGGPDCLAQPSFHSAHPHLLTLGSPCSPAGPAATLLRSGPAAPLLRSGRTKTCWPRPAAAAAGAAPRVPAPAACRSRGRPGLWAPLRPAAAAPARRPGATPAGPRHTEQSLKDMAHTAYAGVKLGCQAAPGDSAIPHCRCLCCSVSR
jgi:hypothetical protein